MIREVKKWGMTICVSVISIGLIGCSANNLKKVSEDSKIQSEKESQETSKETETETTDTKNSVDSSVEQSQLQDLPEGFPKEIPFYEGAKIIEADNFNGNNYTVVYQVSATFEDVDSFYTKEFQLESTGTNDGVGYYEGFDYGDIFIKGLTIEETQDLVNVFMTLQDNRQDMEMEGYSESEEMDSGYTEEESSEGSENGDITTYDNATEIDLDDSFPKEIVPVYTNAKVVSCSMVPGTSSGFADFIAPADEFEDVVSFYTKELGLKANSSNSVVQEAAQFKGDIDKFQVVVVVTHLLSQGNDTLIQVTVNEK